MSGSGSTQDERGERRDQVLRWSLATLVATALSFTFLVVVLHGGADPSAAVGRVATSCAPARTPGDAAPGGVVDGVVSVGSLQRGYRLTLPPAYDGSDPVPLVVLLHGTSGTIDEIEDYTGMVPAAVQRGYAVLTPQGLAPADGSLPTHWTVPGFDAPGSPDDVAFVSGLVDTVTTAYCVDAHRVFATGISGGAAFATELACETDLLAGIAPVAGLNLVPPCENAQPLTVLAINGTADALVAYDGIDVTAAADASLSPTAAESPSLSSGPSGSAFYNGPVQADVARWAAAFGCAASVPGQPSSDVESLTWTGCRDGVSVALWTVHDGGHTWPGAATTPEGLGSQTDTITATTVILDTFDAAPSSGVLVRSAPA